MPLLPPVYNEGRTTSRQPIRREVIPRSRLPTLVALDQPTVVKRSSSSTASSSSDSSGSSTASTLPVVLGVVVPLVIAIVVLIVLHRRHVKKLRHEDANDKHRSLDFGMDVVDSSGPAGGMQEVEKAHTKGMSMDMVNPYLLPPGLQGSRESLHSLSRSITGEDDKFRRATHSILHADNMSVNSPLHGVHDDASSFTGSARLPAGDEMGHGLLRNAQRMSRSSPPLYNPPPGDNRARQSPINPHDNGLELNLPPSLNSGGPPSHGANYPSAYPGMADPDPVQNLPTHATPGQNYDTLPSQEPRLPDLGPLPTKPTFESAQAPSLSIQVPRISFPLSDAASDYGDARNSELMLPSINISAQEEVHKEKPTIPEIPHPPPQPKMNVPAGPDPRRMTLGLRPLPPEDPSDNPEQRANRIRSFYKEYFDESKPGRESYFAGYGLDYYGEVDPTTGEFEGGFVPPYAEPVNRRAMTPPPRAPPRFQGAARHMATNSAGGGGFPPPGPRAFSSASGRLPAPKPRKPIPAPSPLQVLPSPHMLKDDSIMTAAEYAPSASASERREGRPETPRGGLKPFNPMTAIHSPLVSAFDELAAIPSPHALRKSATYTSLDFAPPPRFKNGDTSSDAGSIRSNRTGISATHLQNIRNGAYRISRLPADTVGTKDDLYTSLRPTWDMKQ
ncbi:hypothetical protein ASPZODRAFT_18386 [Penicilliopsis zonata CBS 506.65]|uniref:Uncharacterized protein n=1 Tax=Penicilliopsis zonata CBS 506.65 TaxID=1073090 RepID=A0A1L9SC90_9EURO|nr:hypothetical protein ASPZODRAFT_18386 [Penicilliopsis zonata CBS 506.65]OJJ44825.1 hypothetical protein ASPZODRAFT_18386 [Penicilliopsis zonata CBS 506.65]